MPGSEAFRFFCGSINQQGTLSLRYDLTQKSRRGRLTLRAGIFAFGLSGSVLLVLSGLMVLNNHPREERTHWI